MPAKEALAMEDVKLSCRHMRIMKEYKEDIHKKLKEGLQWMSENDLHPKLEGRYGLLFSYSYLYSVTAFAVL